MEGLGGEISSLGHGCPKLGWNQPPYRYVPIASLFSASSHAETTKRCHWSSNEAIYNEMAANSKIEFSRIISDCAEHFGTCCLEFWGSTLCRRHCLSDVTRRYCCLHCSYQTLGHRQEFQAACTQLQLADGVMTPWFPTFWTLAKKCFWIRVYRVKPSTKLCL